MAGRGTDGGGDKSGGGHNVPIIVALITVSGAMFTAVLANWDKVFGNKPAAGRLFQEQETIALVHGVATDSVGNPVAAKISLERGGRTVTGVIALHTEGLRVSLHPVP